MRFVGIYGVQSVQRIFLTFLIGLQANVFSGWLTGHGLRILFKQDLMIDSKAHFYLRNEALSA